MAHRSIDMHRRRKVRFRVTESTAFRLNVPFIKELGVEFISAADGRSVVALNLEPWHLNSWSVAHGGVLMSLLDVAMAVAGALPAAGAGGGVTAEVKERFRQAAKAEAAFGRFGNHCPPTSSVVFSRSGG